MHRIDCKTNHCEIPLYPNKKQGIKGKYALISKEDKSKVKPFEWKVFNYGGRLTARTYYKDKWVDIREILYPNLKRLHRINDDSLDFRRENLKRNNPNNVEKIETNSTFEFNPKFHNKLGNYKIVSDKDKTIVLSQENYEKIETTRIAKRHGNINETINFLIDFYEITPFVDKPCNVGFVGKLKAILGI